MSDERIAEFRALVKSAHEAIDEYALSRTRGDTDWFLRDLDGQAQRAVHQLLAFKVSDDDPVEWRAGNDQLR